MQRRKTLLLTLPLSLVLLAPVLVAAQSGETYPNEALDKSKLPQANPQNQNSQDGNAAVTKHHDDAAIKELEEDEDAAMPSAGTETFQAQRARQAELTQVPAGYSQARIVRLSYVEGDVRLDRSDGQGFITAFNNLPLIEGARISTESSGRAEIEFEDGSTVRMTPNTMLDLKQLRLSSKGEHISRATIERGEAYFDVKKHGNDEFVIDLHPLREQLRLRKASHFRVAVDNKGVEVAEFKGKLELIRPDGHKVEIGKNETITLEFTDAERYFLARGITADPQDSWDHARSEQVMLAANRRNNPTLTAAYYPGYSYGFSDLNRYGSYVYAPGFGYVWRPYQASLLWDPFLGGSWVWYPGYNYVFVSSYPWGWTPYHYGSWVHVNNVGWCWRPTGNTNFVSITNVINPPKGWRGPRPPRTGIVGGVVAVGTGVPVNNRVGVIDGDRFRGRDGRGGATSGQISNPDQAPRPTNSAMGWRGARDQGAVAGAPAASGTVISPSAANRVNDSRDEVGRFGRGRRDGVPVQNMSGQSASPAVRTYDAQPHRSTRFEGERGMPSRMSEPQRAQPMSAPTHAPMPAMSAPAVHNSAPPAAASPGGRRDK